MSDKMQFQFTVKMIPFNGKAHTGDEIEQRLFHQLKKRGGSCPDTLWNLAVLYSRTRRHEAAIGCVERVRELTDDAERHASCYLALGQLMEKRGDYAAAAEYYRGALSMEPLETRTWYFIHNNLGYCLNQLGRSDEAEPLLKRALEIDPQRANAYKNLGLSYEARGGYVDAAECYIAATQVQASDARSFKHLEQLVAEHPQLEIDIPDLRDRVEICRRAVEFVQALQPDFDADWLRRRISSERRCLGV